MKASHVGPLPRSKQGLHVRRPDDPGSDIPVKRNLMAQEQRRVYLWFVLPAVLVYFAVMAFPTVFSLGLSVTDYNGGPLFRGKPINFVGLRQYVKMFQDKFFWISLKNNVYIILVSVFGQIPLGFVIAYVLYRRLVKWTGFFQAVIYLPSVISTIVVAILWKAFFSPFGAFTDLMQYIKPGWLNTWALHPQLAIVPVLFVMLWLYTGLYLIIFLANLQKLSPEMIEAARIDGASELQILRHVILPALSGVVLTTAILAISGSLKSFDLIYAMTGGNPARRTSVLALYMYDSAFRGAPDYPLANAISTFMVLFSVVLIFVLQWVEKRIGGRET